MSTVKGLKLMASTEFHEVKDTEDDDDAKDEDEDEKNVKERVAQKDAEYEELEKEYTSLLNRDKDILMNLMRHKDEDFLKGQAVRNQKALWDKTLELRFSLQKAFSSSNKLPWNISEQVAGYMRDPSRMIKRMQLRTPVVGVFGANTNEDGDLELLEDSEFYQQLLKEFFESFKSTTPEATEAAFYAIKRHQTKKRNIVGRRASKSRKIRYHVHEKIANFMVPKPMKLPDMAPVLFENLFDFKCSRLASVA
ncbi:rRNA processing protein-like protein [Thalictrum thalictroides]|uniref:rRNA processing protein-like protein n=1 Tax=Thalictrum thalictroides TaxID=46969 RepID=A0A7J6VQ85_THATH|nr:rRNA processing protein-like protein [Thalictrum thalictroides]